MGSNVILNSPLNGSIGTPGVKDINEIKLDPVKLYVFVTTPAFTGAAQANADNTTPQKAISKRFIVQPLSI